jgi:hypothetical protein
MQVVDLPLNDYIKFGIKYYLNITSKSGQETFFIERKNVNELVRVFKDYWMFDSKRIIPMNYKEYGTYIIMGDPVIMDSVVNKYSELNDKLLDRAMPMSDFLDVNRINL